MSKSLFYQFNSAIDLSFIPHFDKHSSKKNHITDDSHVIKSLSAKHNLKDFAHTFSKYIKDEYNIKQVKDITPLMCQKFIDIKIQQGCSEETIFTYKSNLLKLSKCVNKTFTIKTDYNTNIDKEKIERAETTKQFSFTMDEMKMILDTDRKCESLKALNFAFFTGCRVNTLEKIEVRHLDFKNKEIIIYKDKGGRTRKIQMDEQTEKFCRDIIKGKQPQDKLFNIKKDSVNRYLHRRCEKLGIKTSIGETKSGVHGIRKLRAEEYAKHHGKKETMKMLGHGADRSDLEQTYLHSKK